MSSGASDYVLAELCAVACAEAFRGDGEILASAMGTIPSIGARLARATFSPDLLLTDGVASLIAGDDTIEGWLPYRHIFDVVWSGRRHVMMGASQIDRFGNQNISAVLSPDGDFQRPRSMLLGMRGAPGNTIHHATSYFVPAHSPRTFVPRVDVVCGVGTDRARALGPAGRFHDLRRVVSNLGVFDFRSPELDGAMRVVSLHPGVTVDVVLRATGFPLAIPNDVATTRAPTDEELRLLREVIDPRGLGRRELSA